MKWSRLISVAVAAALVPAACARPGDDRAARELEVGHAQRGAIALDVDDGAAAIRELDDAGARLWAGAPSFVARLRTSGSARTFRLALENVLHDALLTPRSGATPPLAIRQAPGGAPTEQLYEIDLPADADVVLDLAPRRPEEAPFRFLVFADVQEAIDGVQDIYRRMNEVEDARFVMMVGDQTRRGGDDELERFRTEMKTLRFPVYQTLGNHELGASDPPPYYDFFGRASYNFVFGGVAFTFLDSASATIDPRVYEWLDGWLDANRSRMHVVAMHIPPVDPVGVRNGAFASHNEAQRLLARLARGNVDLTLYGHVHTFHAFANAGIPAYISGGGGSIPERFDGIGRHFLKIDADPAKGSLEVGIVRVDVSD